MEIYLQPGVHLSSLNDCVYAITFNVCMHTKLQICVFVRLKTITLNISSYPMTLFTLHFTVFIPLKTSTNQTQYNSNAWIFSVFSNKIVITRLTVA